MWWEDGDPKLPVKIYQLSVHTFGLTSSPSIASFALRRTAEENRVICSGKAVETIKRNMYVDDLLTSVKSCEEGIHLIRELNALLESGGFKMAKYSSNSPEVLEAIPNELLAPQLQELEFNCEELSSHKTLGLYWNPNLDELRIKVTIGTHPMTRRGLLSTLASVYDPLGMAGPFLLPAKLLLQRLSKQGLDWDTIIADADCRD